MKKKHLLIFNIVMLCMVIFSNLNAQSSISNKESARAFVQKFYDWYVVLYSAPIDKKNPDCACMVALNKRPEYFDAVLRKAIIDDNVAQSKAKGEIVGLDADPFLNAQDTGFGYQTGNVKQVGEKYFVDIHVAEEGKSRKESLSSEIAVVAELHKVNARWVFKNFIYPVDGKQYDLLTTLRNLSKDRNKFTK